MGMAKFLQFQDKPAKVEWSSAAKSEAHGVATPGSSSDRSDIWPPNTPCLASLAGALIAFKRFLAKRDDPRSWLPAVASRQDARPEPRADGALHGGLETSPGTPADLGTAGPHYRSSVWGCWL